MGKKASPEPKIYWTLFSYQTGYMHMWTSLLKADERESRADSTSKSATKLADAALMRFRCFAAKRTSISVRSAQIIRGPEPVKTFPGRFAGEKFITDVLNYFGEYDARGRRTMNTGTLYAWKLLPKPEFRLAVGPEEINSTMHADFFPELPGLKNK